MAIGNIPNMGTRVNVQMFTSDLLAHQGLVMVESYPDLDTISAVFSDHAGVKVSFTGDRSSVRMILSAALVQIPTGTTKRSLPRWHQSHLRSPVRKELPDSPDSTDRGPGHRVGASLHHASLHHQECGR